MLNFRCIGDRFALSGGWQDIEKDAKFLKDNNIFAVLDLQFTNEDSSLGIASVTEAMSKNLINFHFIRMFDSEFNPDFEGILEEAFGVLSEWEKALDIQASDAAKIIGKSQLVSLGFSSPKILVKCGAGNSRSVCVLIAYLCMSRRWSFEFAKNWVQDLEDVWLGINHATSHFFGMGIGMESFFTFKLRELFPENISAFGIKEF
jgi:hypothetical protein